MNIEHYLNKFFPKTPFTRMLFFLVSDIFFITLSVYLAFLLRFDGAIPAEYISVIKKVALLALIFCLPIFYFSRLYSFAWSYVSTEELIAVIKSTALGFLFLGITLYFSRYFPLFFGFPRSTLFISFFLIILFCGGVRFAKRVYLQIFKEGTDQDFKEKTLIVGAGDAGEQVLRSILASRSSFYLPIGFVDDKPMKQGEVIHGLKVLGRIDNIPKIVSDYKVEQMIIALPSVGSSIIKKAVEIGRKAGLKKIKVIPSITEIINGETNLGDIREVQIEDLLGREPVSLDTKSIEEFIRQKSVLITGGAGSIGSELCRQVARFKPSLLVVLDQDETGIFNISKELKKRFPNLNFSPVIADIKDEEKMNEVFVNFRPNLIFHAAAYKHVPLMEAQPDEAVKNNIFGTKIICDLAIKNDAEKFIFISTDKAVNPSSAMGATKRLGEMICQVLNQVNKTKFISVRFGNVLNSRGSVIPLFREQIKSGGPVEVTHPEMKRYFMVTAEACLLVMQAGAMGQGGEVFVLDMGEPIRILDLAKEMIRLSGFEPDKDIPIVFTGIRPGEKLFEEILTAEEGTITTQNQKIFMARLSKVDEGKLREGLERLKVAAKKSDKDEIIRTLKELIPAYS